MFALIATEELTSAGQIMVKQLKNRYNDPNVHKRFVIGVDRSRMKLKDILDAKVNLMNDTPVFENSKMNEKFKDFKME